MAEPSATRDHTMFKTLRLPAGGEIGIVALIVAIISLMILPLPPTVLGRVGKTALSIRFQGSCVFYHIFETFKFEQGLLKVRSSLIMGSLCKENTALETFAERRHLTILALLSETHPLIKMALGLIDVVCIEMSLCRLNQKVRIDHRWSISLLSNL